MARCRFHGFLRQWIVAVCGCMCGCANTVEKLAVQDFLGDHRQSLRRWWLCLRVSSVPVSPGSRKKVLAAIVHIRRCCNLLRSWVGRSWPEGCYEHTVARRRDWKGSSSRTLALTERMSSPTSSEDMEVRRAVWADTVLTSESCCFCRVDFVFRK